MRKISLLVATAACLSVGGLAPASLEAAKEKSALATVPAPFTAKEKANGAKNHPEILKEFGGVYDSPQTPYVVRIAKKIAVQSGLAANESDFTVSFLNSPVNNAFAIEGGYIYITRQLVALCNSEAEMGGVLGHEWGHTFARHSQKRQKDALLKNILGTGGTILGSVLGDKSGLLGMIGQGLRQYSGPLAQIFTLKFSRKQEEEADDLGILYLSRAGYDPSALSSMLNSLALQTALDQRVAGHMEGPIPEWASTHPDPIKRVGRAAANAKKYAASTVRNADAHFKAIDGMMVDDDPKEGVVEGQEFLHRDLRLKFAVPTGFGMANSSNAVQINGTGGKALFTLIPNYTGDRAAYIAAAFKQMSGENQTIAYGPIGTKTINGIPAFYSEATVKQESGSVLVTVFAYEMSGTQAYHFVTITPVNTNPFSSMFESFARMGDSEAATIKARKLKIVTVGASDTVASLSNRMAYKNYQSDRFLALNGMTSASTLTKGQKVKIVTY